MRSAGITARERVPRIRVRVSVRVRVRVKVKVRVIGLYSSSLRLGVRLVSRLDTT